MKPKRSEPKMYDKYVQNTHICVCVYVYIYIYWYSVASTLELKVLGPKPSTQLPAPLTQVRAAGRCGAEGDAATWPKATIGASGLESPQKRVYFYQGTLRKNASTYSSLCIRHLQSRRFLDFCF